MDNIRVLLVEDDISWISAMEVFFLTQEDIYLVKSAKTMEESLEIVKTNDIDVILMDINLTENNHDGIYAAAEISQFCNAKIIMLTSLSQEEVIINSFTAGAVNYISKSNYKELPNEIRKVHREKSPLEYLLKEYSKLKREEQLKGLTNAEKEIYNMLEAGYSKAQIMNKLYKSENTLKNQINNILKKLNVKNYMEAVKKVRTKGIFKSKNN